MRDRKNRRDAQKKSLSSDCLNILIVTDNPIKRSGRVRSSTETDW